MVAPIKKTRVAVVGSGMGGLSTVYNVWKQVGYKCPIDLYEPTDTVGSGWRGVSVEDVPLELGTPVISAAAQPELFTFIREIGVKRRQAERSVFVGEGKPAHGSSRIALWWLILTTLFSAPLEAITLLVSLRSFYRAAWKYITAREEDAGKDGTLRDFSQRAGLSGGFTEAFLVPLAVSVWPVPPGKALDLPAYPILRALADNYLLTYTAVSWFAFNGKDIVDTVLDKCRPTVHLSTPVTSLQQQGSGRWLVNGAGPEYDAVALSVDPCAAGITLQTEEGNARDLVQALKDVQYDSLISYYHTDDSTLPKDKKTWASTHVTSGGVTYNENDRSALHTSGMFTSVIPENEAATFSMPKDKYLHEPKRSCRPRLSEENRKLEARLRSLTGSGGLYVCGSAFGVDLMEADYKTGVAIANIHSDRAVPTVREQMKPNPAPMYSLYHVIQHVITWLQVPVFSWGMEGKIPEGAIGVLLPGMDALYFGQEQGPCPIVRVVDRRFLLLEILFGEYAYSDSIIRRWTQSNNLSLLAAFLTYNMAGKKNLFQRMLTYVRPPVTPIFHNYDHIGDFFGCIMDDTNTFSTAIFAHEDEPMEDAQWRKLDRMVSLLKNIDENSTVLEVGAGWGSFAIRLVQKVGCKVVCATTSPIEPIFEAAKKFGLEDKITADQIDLLDIPKYYGSRKFDAIVMIEVIEETDERNYDPYFKILSDSLVDGGQLAMQISCGNNTDYLKKTSDLIRMYAYAGDALPTLGDVYHTCARHNLIFRDILRITGNYVHVGRNWMRNFLSKVDTKGAVFSEDFKFSVKAYLQMVPAFAIANQTHTYQISLDKMQFDASPLY